MSLLEYLYGSNTNVLEAEFPTSRNEDWKYTRVAPALNGDYTRRGAELPEPAAPLFDCYLVQMVDGTVSPASDLPAGLSVHFEPNISERNFSSEAIGFGRLQHDHSLGTLVIAIADRVQLDKPILAQFTHSHSGMAVVCNVRLSAGEGAKALVCAHFVDASGKAAYHQSHWQVSVATRAALDVVMWQQAGVEGRLYTMANAQVGADAVFRAFTLSQSGLWVRNELNITLEGERGEAHMYGLYNTHGRQHVDNHTRVTHAVPNCNSSELYRGVLDGKSTAVFNGKIYVATDAQKTNAFQSNANVLLSDAAAVYTKPELEIYADDVKCSHGCTVGQLDDEAVFYLRSRGLSDAQARRMLIGAFAAAVIEHVPIEAVANHFRQLLEG